jgi:A/G-specific adenine glycosylase
MVLPPHVELKSFVRTVRSAGARRFRRFPWRPPALRARRDGSLDPYRILVSEVMLQQTQAARVAPFYRAFVRRFPSVRSLADAPLSAALSAWSGLGYNRRALFLQRAARIIVREYGGQVPRSAAALAALPGIGAYTLGAVACFAWNEPAVLIETNIRSVFIHHFFRTSDGALRAGIADRDILPLVAATLPRANPRAWYYALMDYGASLKARGENPGRASAHYARQGRFRGSDREARGRIIRALAREPRSLAALARIAEHSPHETARLLEKLVRDGLVARAGGRYRVA